MKKQKSIVKLNLEVNLGYVPKEDMDYTGYVEFVEQDLRFNYQLRLGATLPKLLEIWGADKSKFWEMLSFNLTDREGHSVEADDLAKRALWMSIGKSVFQLGYSQERFTEEGYRSQKHLALVSDCIGVSISQGLRLEGVGIRRDQASPTGEFELDEFLKRYENQKNEGVTKSQ
jgi:hypothetical protein